MVQHTFGHLPKDSLVVIGLSAGATGGHLRVDLAPILQEPDRLGLQCAEWIAGPDATPVPEAAMALIFDSEMADPDAPDRYDIVMASLAEGLLQRAGAHLVRVWHVGHGFIRDYENSEFGDRESFLGEDAESVLNATMQRIPELSRSRASSPAEALAQFLQPPEPVTQDQLKAVRDHNAPPPSRAEAVIALWEAALRRSLREAPAGGRAKASWIHRSPSQISALLRTLEEPENLKLLMALVVTSVDVVEDASWIGESESGAALADSVWGVSAHPPHWERVESLSALLPHLFLYAVNTQRAEILGLRSWIEWIRGSASTATVFAEEVRRQYPDEWSSHDDPLVARTVVNCVRLLGVCPWARVKESSYSWWLGSR